jgi:hypothetical protein
VPRPRQWPHTCGHFGLTCWPPTGTLALTIAGRRRRLVNRLRKGKPNVRPQLVLEHLELLGLRQQMANLWEEEISDLIARPLPRAEWPFGKRLTAAGWNRFLEATREALTSHDMHWLANQMRLRHYWTRTATQHRRTGNVTVQVNAEDEATKLSHGEFNTAYVRAVALRALAEGFQCARSFEQDERSLHGTRARTWRARPSVVRRSWPDTVPTLPATGPPRFRSRTDQTVTTPSRSRSEPPRVSCTPSELGRMSRCQSGTTRTRKPRRSG